MSGLHEALSGLCAPFPDDALPPLDRAEPPAAMTWEQAAWREHGYLILEGFMPDDLIDTYCAAWLRAHGIPIHAHGQAEPVRYVFDPADAHGWADCTPYMRVPELAAVVCYEPLADALEHLIGEPTGVHLNLTGWVSTTRDWHQDGYLNPDHVADWYAAVWVALDDIGLDAGPFEYVRGSHRWPTIRRDLMLARLGETGDDPDWPRRSERVLTPIFEEHLAAEHLRPQRFAARKGDVLIWHARLAHRGSVPANPARERRGLIAHYSGIHHRPDMPAAVQHDEGGFYFPLKTHVPV